MEKYCIGCEKIDRASLKAYWCTNGGFWITVDVNNDPPPKNCPKREKEVSQ